MCSAALGAAAGSVIGGQSLRIFVDVDKVNLNRYDFLLLEHCRGVCHRAESDIFLTLLLSTLIPSYSVERCKKVPRVRVFQVSLLPHSSSDLVVFLYTTESLPHFYRIIKYGYKLIQCEE